MEKPKLKKSQKEFSILLIPKGKIYNEISSVIIRLSNKYNYPVFEPHVTLIGGFDISEKEAISKTSKLAENLKPYLIRINNPIYLHEYYKSIFLKAEKTKEVIKTHILARKIFDDKRDYEYFPHLSLMYGNSSNKIKEKIVSEIKNINLEFKIDQIHLFSTANGPENWYKIKEFNLKCR